MAGFDNEVVYGSNVDFTGNATVTGQVTTDGQLLIGATAAPNIKVGTLTSPSGTLTIGYSTPNITLDLAGGSLGIDSIGVDATSGGGTNPVLPTVAGLVTNNGAVVAAGTNPVRTVSTAANVYQTQLQISQALAATDATKIGLANFDSAKFTVDANGFVSASGTGLGQTITGDTGGALSPSSGNWNILGTAAQGLSFAGSGSTLTGTIANATTTQIGVSALATDAEAIAGSDSTETVTPSSLKAKLGTQTNHGVLVGAGQTAAVTALAVGADHSLLIGATGADPSFTTTGTPYVTSISFDAGTNSLSNYTNAGSWTPTVVGSGTAGTTTYTTQAGAYVRIGNLVWITGTIVITGATGTGNANFSLPIAVRSGANLNAFGSILISGAGWAFPASTVYPVFAGVGGSSIAIVQCAANGVAGANLQMANAACTFGFSMTYYV